MEESKSIKKEVRMIYSNKRIIPSIENQSENIRTSLREERNCRGCYRLLRRATIEKENLKTVEPSRELPEKTISYLKHEGRNEKSNKNSNWRKQEHLMD